MSKDSETRPCLHTKEEFDAILQNPDRFGSDATSENASVTMEQVKQQNSHINPLLLD